VPGRATSTAEIYQIKITLRDSHPPIWRRIHVRSDITLAKLHRIVQCVMGWEDSHIHGYASFLEAIKNSKHPEHEEYREWIGGDFDPEPFDMNKVNRFLRALR
jgi:hypothetical protein